MQTLKQTGCDASRLVQTKREKATKTLLAAIDAQSSQREDESMSCRLSEETRSKLSALACENEAEIAAQIGVARVTLSRALAGLKVQRGTIALIESEFSKLQAQGKVQQS